MGRQLSSLGHDPTLAIGRMRCRSRGRKRERSPRGRSVDGAYGMDIDGDTPSKKQHLSRSHSRSVSRPPHEIVPGEGFKDSAQKIKAIKLAKKSVKKRNKDARRGEAD